MSELDEVRAALAECQDQLDAARGWPWSFVLQRDEDETGVSGTGIVAEGVEFSDHSVALRWISDWPTSVVFHDRGIESVQAVHGHGGKTRIVFTPPLDASTPYRSRLATTEAALTQALAERDGLREALERAEEALDVAGFKACAADARRALATAPNTKDGTQTSDEKRLSAGLASILATQAPNTKDGEG